MCAKSDCGKAPREGWSRSWEEAWSRIEQERLNNGLCPKCANELDNDKCNTCGWEKK